MSISHDRLRQDQETAVRNAPESTEFTYTVRNKFLCTDTDTIAAFRQRVQEHLEMLLEWERAGVTLRDDGGVEQDYATFVTTDKALAVKWGFTVEEEPDENVA